jgi:Ran GTPase-activating protein (RanGAP) involved in mRNA processing and transport
LLTLDLGKNNIGGLDAHKYGYDKNNTNINKLCGELFYNYLSSGNCKLQILLLDWNSIRHDSAIYFINSLRINNTLIELNISYNSIGNEGGEILGNVLTFNKTLKKLYIASNNISPRACVVIATG